MESDWKAIAAQYADFSDAKQAALRKTVAQCAKDTGFSVKGKDFEDVNFQYFALCLRSNVVLNPSLNGSQGVRSSILGWNY